MAYSDLGDKLRDAEYRRAFLPELSTFIDRSITDLDQNVHSHDILRCLVNICADNDANREYVVSRADLWIRLGNAQKLQDDVFRERVVILLTQFIHNTDKKTEFMKGFASHFSHHVIDLLHVNDCDYFEWVSEFVHSNRDSFVERNESDYCYRLAEALVGVLENGDLEEESPLHISRAIADLLSFDSMPTGDLNMRIVKLLGYKEAKVNRFLFAACGCISSMKDYNSKSEVEESIDFILNKNGNSYAVAACAINVGNFITSQETLSYVVSQIPSPNTFVEKYTASVVTDVVQVQSIHMLTNLLSEPTFVQPIVEHLEEIQKTAKIIVDNVKYYSEVFSVFLRFCNKLIQKCPSVWKWQEFWKYILSAEGTQETGYLILQGYMESPGGIGEDFLGQLVENVAASPGSIPFHTILAKLKTLGIYFHKVNDIEQLKSVTVAKQDVIFPAHLKFIRELGEELKKETPPVLRNNTKFVCATTVGALKTLNLDSACVQELTKVCESIIKE